MSLDKSLKGKSSLERHRNVLTRAERIEKLQELGTWREDSTPLGLPKVAHRKVATGKKEKAVKDEESGADAEADAATTEKKG